MVTTEQLIEKLTIELGNMMVNNISLGMQVDDYLSQVNILSVQVTALADRNISFEARSLKDTEIIVALKSDLNKAGVRSVIKTASLPADTLAVKVKRKL